MKSTFFYRFFNLKSSGYKVIILCAVFLFTGFTYSSAQLIGTIGASVGNGFINKELKDINGEDFKIDQNNLAWKVFAATNWKFLGLEGGYRDFGKVEETYDSGKITMASHGGDIYATGTFKFVKILAAFAKAGAYFGKTTTEFYDGANTLLTDETVKETSFAWGIGAAVNVSMLHIRLEYESMQISSGSLGMLSLGVGVNLGKKK